MALKADRYELQTDISFFYNDVAKSRGGVLVHDSTTASGAAMDQGVNLVKYKTAASTDIPVGILLNDVVDKDLTRTHLNQHKDEVQKGGKVTVLRKGYVVTNMITGTPNVGGVAYACDINAGNISVGAVSAAASGALGIGRFMTDADEDGYAKVEINLPYGHAS
jgi:hypothetical protein|tara:strand:- start:14038 stop:14529 length:492 start_codon:yes stop_codon:yes gene_type:complete